ncbi:MAG: hypothetical protein QQW96_20715 [Tychonema bourrellyi B0820]|nr:hypothetical protein [Tychonema bourrellyi B0820]
MAIRPYHTWETPCTGEWHSPLPYMGNALYGRMAIRPYAPYNTILNAPQLIPDMRLLLCPQNRACL